jgi:hypothetical protein
MPATTMALLAQTQAGFGTSFHWVRPPDFILEGLFWYAIIAVVALMVTRSLVVAAVLIGAVVVPTLFITMPVTAAALGIVILAFLGRRWGWRWLTLIALSFLSFGVFFKGNLADLGPLTALAPGAVLAATIDAGTATILFMAVIVAAWMLSLFFTGKLIAIFRGGLAGERMRRIELTEVKALNRGRERTRDRFLTRVTGGRYQSPAARQQAAAQAARDQRAARQQTAAQARRDRQQATEHARRRTASRPIPAADSRARQRARARTRRAS